MGKGPIVPIIIGAAVAAIAGLLLLSLMRGPEEESVLGEAAVFTPCPDNDRDGYDGMAAGCLPKTAVDCDDTDAVIGAAVTYYGDADMDGYGNATLSASACYLLPGYVLSGTDCDDNNRSITVCTLS